MPASREEQGPNDHVRDCCAERDQDHPVDGEAVVPGTSGPTGIGDGPERRQEEHDRDEDDRASQDVVDKGHAVSMCAGRPAAFARRIEPRKAGGAGLVGEGRIPRDQEW